MHPFPLVLHPGWQNSGPTHWQSHWQLSEPRTSRVMQNNWLQPERDAWVQVLDQHLQTVGEPVLLAAHSLGCITLAHWAQRSTYTHLVHAALLVAPADVASPSTPDELAGFAPIPMTTLPFPTLLVASDNDPFCQLARAHAFAQAWGAHFTVLKGAGHINAESGLGGWPAGLSLLHALAKL